jgi:diketogulonate reductase-like aldo/keto reductase
MFVLNFIFLIGLLNVAWSSGEEATATELSLVDHKEYDQCDIWAEHDGECVNNPRFMWSACLGSCLEYAADIDEQCRQWAQEGECEANPGYIHLHCPGACSEAISWNPWVRQQLNIDHIRSAAFVEDSLEVVDLLSAANLMQKRLESIFVHRNVLVQGVSVSAPSHFLGMIGFAEMFLYTFRLQEVILRTLGDEESFALLRERLDQAIRTIEMSHFNADLLSRELPFWMRFVRDVRSLIDGVISKTNQQNMSVPAIEIAKYFSSYIPSDTSGFTSSPEDLAGSDNNTMTVRLSSGYEMPLLGLGTWQLDGDDCYNAVLEALAAGHRAIDTAQAYGNEAEVGRAVADAIQQGIITSRSEVFLATKISNEQDFGEKNVRDLVSKQLKLLQTDYIDLYMLHSPPQDANLEEETWRELEHLVKEGKIRSLGVSNYEPRELDRLLAVAKVKPSVTQNKVDPYHVGKQLDVAGDEIVAYCRQHGIVLVGYSPFSAYPFAMEATQDPLVRLLATQRSRMQPANQFPVTPAQLIIKWMVQRGMAVIPRSSHPGRMLENLHALRLAPLTADELAVMDSLQVLVSSPVSVPISLL